MRELPRGFWAFMGAFGCLAGLCLIVPGALHVLPVLTPIAAAAVAGFARLVLRAARADSMMPEPLSPPQVAEVITKSTVPGSSRALGWDTMLPTSSCGTQMSPAAFGHVGFTGTSLWIDPLRDRFFVLLTNRACRGGTLEQMRAVRRTFHDSLADL
jgi:CubicO group peptidase (beta-lactamase class C family)